MVAASKLRRAQEAAEASRPYAERMERMVASVAQTVLGDETAPKLLRGTGSTDRHFNSRGNFRSRTMWWI